MPRRDAAVAVLDNKGSSNGYLLMFGGLTGSGTSYPSPLMSYLRRSRQQSVTALNDLWYLDLSGLSQDCLMKGVCGTVLPWKLIEVPGTRPTPRWGAGMSLDSFATLFVTGGATYSSTKGYSELDELFTFRLRDAFYKKCSATGEGLRSAIAGVPSKFLIQCQDAFGKPAAAANFRIEIAGPVSMSPKAQQLSQGFYQVSYTAIRAGSGASGYTISIYVGRGAKDYQDLIAGLDPTPFDNIHQAYTSTENAVPFDLSVAPGATSPQGSVAVGTPLTLITAGTIGSFVITARDAFENRRPGGDNINVIIVRWDVKNHEIADVNAAPETGTVSDNSDGSYGTVYSITRAGIYQMQIQFGAELGAGSPFLVDVKTSAADLAKTYVFGDLLKVQAGRASTCYVQTRDKYGNNIRVEPDPSDPDGPDEIDFELCTEVGDHTADTQLTLNAPCKGGVKELSIGITTSYGVGTDGKSLTASGEPNYGAASTVFSVLPRCRTCLRRAPLPMHASLSSPMCQLADVFHELTLCATRVAAAGLYKIDFFPFIAREAYFPRVKHNRVYASCYFASSEDPGPDLVNECLADVAIASSARRALREPVLTVRESNIAHEALARVEAKAAAAEYEMLSGRRGAETGIRRVTKYLTDADLTMNITTLFVPPDNSVQQSLIFAVPILCIIIAASVEILMYCHRFIAWRKRLAREKADDEAWSAHLSGSDGDEKARGGAGGTPAIPENSGSIENQGAQGRRESESIDGLVQELNLEAQEDVAEDQGHAPPSLPETPEPTKLPGQALDTSIGEGNSPRE